MYTLSIELSLSFDANGDIIISNTDSNITKNSAAIIKEKRTIVPSEIRYGIITFGAKSQITKRLLPDTAISVVYQGVTYRATVHKTVKGRIDGLTALLSSDTKKFRVSHTIECKYDTSTNTLDIS